MLGDAGGVIVGVWSSSSSSSSGVSSMFGFGCLPRDGECAVVKVWG